MDAIFSRFIIGTANGIATTMEWKVWKESA